MATYTAGSIIDTLPGAPADHVKEVIRQTEQQLRSLMEERREVAKRIRTVKQTITGLANLFDGAIVDPAAMSLVGRIRSSRQRGITRTCRQVLLDAQRPMTSREVLNAVHQSVPDLLNRHKDSMATIHTILNRLVRYGEVAMAVDDRGKRAWVRVASQPAELAGD